MLAGYDLDLHQHVLSVSFVFFFFSLNFSFTEWTTMCSFMKNLNLNSDFSHIQSGTNSTHGFEELKQVSSANQADTMLEPAPKKSPLLKPEMPSIIKGLLY